MTEIHIDRKAARRSPGLSSLLQSREPFAAKRLAQKVAARLSPPALYADLFLTEDCDHRCSYCFVRGKNPQHMSPEVARDAIDYLLGPKARAKKVCMLLFGGEPLLRFDMIPPLVEYAKRVAKRQGRETWFDITTNAVPLTEEMLAWFRKEKIKFLVSIDGDRATHDRHRKLAAGGSSYDAVIEKLPLLKRYQPWQGARMTVMPDVVERLYDNLRHLYARGINQFIIGPASGVKWTDEGIAEYGRQLEQIGYFHNRENRAGHFFRMTLFERSIDKKPKSYENLWGCGAGKARVCVSATGDLYGCAKILGVDGLKNTHKLGDIWSGVTNIRARMDLLRPNVEKRTKCVQCSLKDECAGGCPATNYEATGCVFLPSELDCKMLPIVKRIREVILSQDERPES